MPRETPKSLLGSPRAGGVRLKSCRGPWCFSLPALQIICTVTRWQSMAGGWLDSLIKKIISGGQTGADRAALDFAITRGIAHGGWCPNGRWAEDGRIPGQYQVIEAPSPDPVQRSEWNVRDSDGTAILSISQQLVRGSKKTEEF